MDRDIRGIENESKGLGRQVEGKKDEVLGAATGDTSRELKGKLNKGVVGSIMPFPQSQRLGSRSSLEMRSPDLSYR